MKYELKENKWVMKYKDWDLAWTRIREVDEKIINEIKETFEKITCEKYEEGNKLVVINLGSKFEIIIKNL